MSVIADFERALYGEQSLQRRHRMARRTDLLNDIVFIRKIVAEIAFIGAIAMILVALACFLIFLLGLL